MSLESNVDYTLLKSDATWNDIVKICEVYLQNKYASICVNPKFIRKIKRNYPEIRVCSVVDFPLGASDLSGKINQMVNCIEMGAEEVDVVMDIGLFKEDPKQLQKDLETLAIIAHNYGKIIKIIVEACLWSTEELCQLIKICDSSQIDYIKTSTGMHKLDTQEHELVRASRLKIWIELLSNERKIHDYQIKIKASGGITTRSQAENLIALGADRIGTSKIL